MRTRLLLACLAPFLLGQQCIGPATPGDGNATLPPPPARVENPRVSLNTPQGTIVVELFAVQAPETTRIFLQNVRDKYFDDTIIHWARADEGIRGGRYRADLTAKSVSATIPNESVNQVPNRRRYIAMVASSASGTTSAEFVIYTKDSRQYDYVAGDTPQMGRTVFGRVVDGMGVVDAIAALKTKTATASNGTSLPN
ncbi:MAG: peptidylprolyl isomerase, partial [Phycisphaerae bacterium]